MKIVRRNFLNLLGASLTAPTFALAMGDEAVEIAMAGRKDGSRVWFDPIGLHVRPGQSVRWVNRDPVNVHTASAYHPANDGHRVGIPDGARPWNSGYLQFGESFEIRVTVEGVYDYYCIPHELAGMVGRIVVGDGPYEDAGVEVPAGPDVACQRNAALPDPRLIRMKGRVRPCDDRVER